MIKRFTFIALNENHATSEHWSCLESNNTTRKCELKATNLIKNL